MQTLPRKMMAVTYRALIFLGRYSQWVLISGLLIGGLSESAALTIRPYLTELIFCLLALSAFRIGLQSLTAQGPNQLARSGILVLAMQALLPAVLMGIAYIFDSASHPMMLSIILMASAPSVTATPALAIILKEDPAGPLRLLLIGTAIMPLTALPPLLFLDIAGDLTDAMILVGKLGLIILGACLLGLFTREITASHFQPHHIPALDGLSAILLAVIVVGLMSALAPALTTSPVTVLYWVGFACLVNFGLQILAFGLLRRTLLSKQARGLCLVAGNRNIALFLTILPEDVMAPLMIFIACYQIPMYMTPVFHKSWLRLTGDKT